MDGFTYRPSGKLCVDFPQVCESGGLDWWNALVRWWKNWKLSFEPILLPACDPIRKRGTILPFGGILPFGHGVQDGG